MSQTKNSAFDRMVEEIQKQIIEDERAAYSQKVIEEYYNPKNLGRMSDPDAVGIVCEKGEEIPRLSENTGGSLNG